MRLVMQVGANDHGIIFITVCQHLPVSYSAGLRIRRCTRARTVYWRRGDADQDDVQTDLAGIADKTLSMICKPVSPCRSGFFV